MSRRLFASLVVWSVVLSTAPGAWAQEAPVVADETVEEFSEDPVVESLPPVEELALPGAEEPAMEPPVDPDPELARPGWASATVDAAAPVGGGELKLGELPIALSLPEDALGAEAGVRAEVLDPATVSGLSPFGAAIELDFSVRDAPVSPAAAYEVTIDFSDVRLSQHGMALSRVRLMWATGCRRVEVKSTDEIPEGTTTTECAARVEVPAEIDWVNRVIRAKIDEEALANQAGVVLELAAPAVDEQVDEPSTTTTTPTPTTSTTTPVQSTTSTTLEPSPTTTTSGDSTTTTVAEGSTTTAPAEPSTTTAVAPPSGQVVEPAEPEADGNADTEADVLAVEPLAGEGLDGSGTVLALMSGVGGSDGNFGSTAFSSLLDYQVGLFTGSADLEYTIPVPAAADGPTPEVKLVYSSGSIDGMNTSANAQSGPIGLGWSLNTAYISRFTTQDPDDCGSTAALCRTGDFDYSITLNGVSSRLVSVGGSINSYYLQSDPRWRVTRTASVPADPNNDVKPEQFTVTTPDGIQYRFGSIPTTTNSVQWARFYDTSTSWCGNATSDICKLAYQWNLDEIEDPVGNRVRFFYEHETNVYDPAGSVGAMSYVAAAHLERIDMLRFGSGTPNSRVVFHWEVRCGNASSTFGQCDPGQTDYPDVPYDLWYYGAGNTAAQNQSFFTMLRLGAVTTQVRGTNHTPTSSNATSDWVSVGYYDLAQSFPTPPSDPEGDTDGSEKKLMLYRVHQRPGGQWVHSAFEQLEAEDNDSGVGSTTITTDVGQGSKVTLANNQEVIFNDVWFGDPAGNASGLVNQVFARVHSTHATAAFTIRVDRRPVGSTTWTQFATLTADDLNGEWANVASATLTTAVSGVQDLRLRVTTATAGAVLNVNWVRMRPADFGDVSSLPAVDYAADAANPWVWRRNRDDSGNTTAGSPGSNGVSPMMMARIGTLANELGGRVTFEYSTHQPGQSNTLGTCDPYTVPRVPPTWYGKTNTSYCFPEWDPWTGSGGLVVWRKHVVVEMTKDDSSFTGNQVETYTYAYTDARWHETNLPNRPADEEIPSDFRGHRQVIVNDSEGNTVHRFFQGMHGNPFEATAADKNYSVTDYQGGSYVDYNWLAGRPLEVLRRSGTSNRHLTRTVYYTDLTAGSSTDIYAAYFVAPGTVTERVFDDAGSYTSAEGGTRAHAYTYDAYGNVLTDQVTGAVTGRTHQTEYRYNATDWLVDRPFRQRTWPGAGIGVAGEELEIRVFYYDGQAAGANPTDGLLTRTRDNTNKVGEPAAYADTFYTYHGTLKSRVEDVTGPNGNVTRTGYNSTHGYVIAVTEDYGPLGGDLNYVTSYQYDAWARQTRVTDPATKQTNLTYDDYSRLLTVKLPGDGTDPSIKYAYAASQRPARVTSQYLVDTVYQTTWDWVDGFGRSLQTQTQHFDGTDPVNPSGRRIVARQYDATGQLHRESSAFVNTGSGGTFFSPDWATVPNYHRYLYDEGGRVEFDRMMSNSTIKTETQHIHDGRRSTTLDMVDRRTARLSDMNGNLVQVDEYSSSTTVYATTTYTYDALDRLLVVRDDQDDTSTGQDDIRITYDMASRKRTLADPDAENPFSPVDWTYTYDANGNLQSQTDPNGQVLWFTYDALDRMTAKRDTTSGGTVLASWTWNNTTAALRGTLDQSMQTTPWGNVVVDNETFDSRNRVTRKSWTVPGAGTFDMAFAYHFNDAPRTVTYPGGNAGTLGEVVTYGYEEKSAELETVSGTVAYVTDMDYHAAGMVEAMTHIGTGSTGRNRSFTYEPSTLNMTWTQAGTGTTTNNISQLSYAFDEFGRVTRSRDFKNANQWTCYQYDKFNRLDRAFSDSDNDCLAYDGTVGANPFNHTYNYDTIGNPTSVTGAGGYTYDPLHKHQATAVGSHTFAYDDAGNMTTRTISGQTAQTLTWDESNRLEQITQGTTTTGFLYDADGARVARRDGTATTVMVDNTFEWSAAGGLVTYYTAAGQTIARRDATGLSWIFADHLGSTSTIWTPAGTALRQRYLPYGRIRGGDPMGTEYGYTGQRLDPTGLMDYGARLYDPVIGRFTSADTEVPQTENPQDLNRYTYVRNNPSNLTDPTGHWPAWDSVANAASNFANAASGFAQSAVEVASDLGQRAVVFATEHRHTIVNVAVGAATAIAIGAVCVSTAGLGCAVGFAAAAAVAGTGAHLAADALSPDDGRDLSVREAAAQASGSAVAGAVCGVALGSGCLGGAVRGVRLRDVVVRGGVSRGLELAAGRGVTVVGTALLSQAAGQTTRTLISGDSVRDRATEVAVAARESRLAALFNSAVFGG